jgi:hypothetical protein
VCIFRLCGFLTASDQIEFAFMNILWQSHSISASPFDQLILFIIIFYVNSVTNNFACVCVLQVCEILVLYVSRFWHTLNVCIKNFFNSPLSMKQLHQYHNSCSRSILKCNYFRANILINIYQSFVLTYSTHMCGTLSF